MELPHQLISSANAAAGLILAFLFLFYTLFFIFSIISKRFNAPQKRLPPEAGGAWPLIGHPHLLRGPEPVLKTLSTMADVYGPIFTLRFGSRRAVVVSSWEIARECFTSHDRIFATRPKLIASELLGYDSAMFVFSQYGPQWHQLRKIAISQLLSNHRLELLKHIRISEVQRSIKTLYDYWVDGGNNNGGRKAVVEMKKWFGDVTLNTIFKMVVGERFTTAFEGVGKERYRTAVKDFFELSGKFLVSDSLPYLKWLDLGGHQMAMKKTAKDLDEVFDKWLKEHQQRRNSGEAKPENDFMDVMLSSFEDQTEFLSFDTDTAIKATCLTLILGGSETTKVTMTWALSLLLNNQQVLKRAQLELDEQIGREREVKESDVQKLVYLQAIVKETLRLYPAGPLSVPHESMEDCTVAGYSIPIGTRLIVNLQKLQRDPFVWEDPNEFRPERFFTNQKDFDVRSGQTDPQLIPFGVGRRMCPGLNFALQVVHLTLANLLHGFEIETPFNEPVDMEENIGLTSVKINPVEVVLTPRLPAQVYK